MTGAAGPAAGGPGPAVAEPGPTTGGPGPTTGDADAGGAPDDRDAQLGRLRQQTRQLVAELPGPLRRVRLRSGEVAIEVEWPAPAGPAGSALGAAVPADPVAGRPPGPESGPPSAGSPPGCRDVVAPIVGTFYRASDPGAEPFVQVGDLVEVGQVVGIVEAMKLMNQVTAEAAGRVSAVLAGDGEPVQFGQALIRLAAT